MDPRIALPLPCSASFVPINKMIKQVQRLIDTVPHLPINELKDGGHFLGETDRIGG